MKTVVKMGIPVLALLVAGCRTGHLYPTGAPVALVQPTYRAWLKPGSTMEDENRARKECGEELRSNEALRKKGLSDERAAAARACMARKGFQRNKKRP